MFLATPTCFLSVGSSGPAAGEAVWRLGAWTGTQGASVSSVRQLKAQGTLCRPDADKACDLEEFCNGTSAECTEDLYVQDGQPCEGGSAVCMQGVCQSADLSCQKVFGKGSKNGSPQCYEEINSQKDRMGHCGSSARGYETCQWHSTVTQQRLNHLAILEVHKQQANELDLEVDTDEFISQEDLRKATFATRRPQTITVLFGGASHLSIQCCRLHSPL
ncbi:hypothetical protein lerEdw1_012708 [Lerista edwardsae]|nr:hypothetical protein lerEdw1_012708 [Lerista edwardsae]